MHNMILSLTLNKKGKGIGDIESNFVRWNNASLATSRRKKNKLLQSAKENRHKTNYFIMDS